MSNPYGQDRFENQERGYEQKEADLVSYAEFAKYIVREMPEGTVIGDPAWWAPRIWRFARHALSDSDGLYAALVRNGYSQEEAHLIAFEPKQVLVTRLRPEDGLKTCQHEWTHQTANIWCCENCGIFQKRDVPLP